MSLLYDHHPANITILYYHEFPAAFITATILISPHDGLDGSGVTMFQYKVIEIKYI
jgi:hypothetical protein